LRPHLGGVDLEVGTPVAKLRPPVPGKKKTRRPGLESPKKILGEKKKAARQEVPGKNDPFSKKGRAFFCAPAPGKKDLRLAGRMHRLNEAKQNKKGRTTPF